MSDDATEAPGLFPKTPGERLRAAREQAGLSLADIGARTRVPQRHLEAIEANDFAALPSVTYAVGFARAYARAVGIDEVAVARDVRTALGGAPRPAAVAEYRPYQIEEPRRVAPRGLVIAGVIVVVVILVGLAVWFSGAFDNGSSGGPAAQETGAPVSQTVPQAAPTAPATPAIASGGTVTLTATDEVWIRVYDADNKTLLLKTMEPGETYTVPADANKPMINIGRPEKLEVKVNGVVVPTLGPPAHSIKNVGISAAALAARENAAAVAPPSSAAASTARRHPTQRPSRRTGTSDDLATPPPAATGTSGDNATP